MGELLRVTALALFVAWFTAWPLFSYRHAIRALARERARTDAYLLTAVPVIAVTALNAWWVLAAPFDGRIALLASVLVAALLTRGTSRVVALTGGPVDADSRTAHLHGYLLSAEQSFRRQDLPMWRAELEAAAESAPFGDDDIRDPLSRALLASKHDTDARERYLRARDLERAVSIRWPPPRGIRRIADAAFAAVFLFTLGWTAVRGIDASLPCIESEGPAGQTSRMETDAAGPLADTLLRDPEPGAQQLTDLPLDLDLAAESRADPDAREALLDAGFVAGHLREWRATDGRLIHADVLEFVDQEGALDYQRDVHGFACRRANEHFDAPRGGVGLQTRYRTGDPIVEQVTWVAGTRRYNVSVTFLDPPPDHSRILAIYESATR